MAVHVSLCGRLGNNLFQYALGRIIAERLGLALSCSFIPQQVDHPGRRLHVSGPSTLPDLATYFPAAPLSIPGRDAIDPVERFEIGPTSWTGQVIPLEAVLANSTPRQIRLHGYFQRFEYFANHLDDIRRWFAVADNGLLVPDVAPDDVVINIRRGLDFGLFQWILPLSYYDAALSSLSRAGRIFICGTDVDETVRQHFDRFDPIYYEGSPIEQFVFMQRFRRSILSNSTFSWWAGLLSDADAIYAPRSLSASCYAFSGFRDVDLHMRSPRYVEIPIPQFEEVEWILTSRIRGGQVFSAGDEVVWTDSPTSRPKRCRNVPGIAHLLSAMTRTDSMRLPNRRAETEGHDLVEIVRTLTGAGAATLEYRYVCAGT